MVVGAIWPSITTGCEPGGHGFYCDRQLNVGTYETRRAGPRDITQPRLWNALASAGRRCLVVDVPITFPQPLPGGAQLVEWGGHSPRRRTRGAPRASPRTRQFTAPKLPVPLPIDPETR